MPRPRGAGDYAAGITEASKMVLLELMTILGSYRDALVLIGGWAPYFLLQYRRRPEVEFEHVGSIDIDLVVDPRIIDEARYATIVRLLRDRGYHPSPQLLYQFERTIVSPLDGREYTIGVDFLTPEPPAGRGRTRHHRQVQPDLRARILKGGEVAFDHRITYSLAGVLPEGGRQEVTIQVADVVASLALKGLALGERYVEKDAYDIYALCAYYGEGPPSVAEALRPCLGEAIVRRGLLTIAARFRHPEAEGPSGVARFLGEGDPETTVRVRQDAFMTVSEVLRLLGLAEESEGELR